MSVATFRYGSPVTTTPGEERLIGMTYLRVHAVHAVTDMSDVADVAPT
jgi:hypothetical protein